MGKLATHTVVRILHHIDGVVVSEYIQAIIRCL